MESFTPVEFDTEPRLLQIASICARRNAQPVKSPSPVASTSRRALHLIEDDNVEHRFVARVRLLLLRVREERTDLLFGTADVLVEDLRAVHNLGLARVEHLADLPRDERFAAARRAIQKHAADVRNPELRDDVRGEETRSERTTKDALELTGQSSDACLRARARARHTPGESRIRSRRATRRRFAPSLAKSKSDVKRSGRFDDLPLSRTNEPVDGTVHSISEGMQ